MTIDTSKIALLIAERIRDVATEQGNVPFLTGDLRKSIIVSPDGPGRAVISSNLPYARAVHDGRPAITIRPKNAKALVFARKSGGKIPKSKRGFKLAVKAGLVIAAKSVHQPARKGRPFIKDAAEEVMNGDMKFLKSYVEAKIIEQLKEGIKNGRWQHY